MDLRRTLALFPSPQARLRDVVRAVEADGKITPKEVATIDAFVAANPQLDAHSRSEFERLVRPTALGPDVKAPVQLVIARAHAEIDADANDALAMATLDRGLGFSVEVHRNHHGLPAEWRALAQETLTDLKATITAPLDTRAPDWRAAGFSGADAYYDDLKQRYAALLKPRVLAVAAQRKASLACALEQRAVGGVLDASALAEFPTAARDALVREARLEGDRNPSSTLVGEYDVALMLDTVRHSNRPGGPGERRETFQLPLFVHVAVRADGSASWNGEPMTPTAEGWEIRRNAGGSSTLITLSERDGVSVSMSSSDPDLRWPSGTPASIRVPFHDNQRSTCKRSVQQLNAARARFEWTSRASAGPWWNDPSRDPAWATWPPMFAVRDLRNDKVIDLSALREVPTFFAD